MPPLILLQKCDSSICQMLQNEHLEEHFWICIQGHVSSQHHLHTRNVCCYQTFLFVVLRIPERNYKMFQQPWTIFWNTVIYEIHNNFLFSNTEIRWVFSQLLQSKPFKVYGSWGKENVLDVIFWPRTEFVEVKEMGFHGHDTAEEATQCKYTVAVAASSLETPTKYWRLSLWQQVIWGVCFLQCAAYPLMLMLHIADLMTVFFLVQEMWAQKRERNLFLFISNWHICMIPCLPSI